MLKKILLNFLRKKKEEKLFIKNDLERKKINFVYRFLLNHYEIQLKDKVDFPAFHYAARDIKHIRETGQLDLAYQSARKCLRENFEKEKAAAYEK